MADPEEPKGDELPGGELSMEDILKTSTRVAYGPIERNLILYLKTLSDTIHQELSSAEDDERPFRVPTFNPPRDINYLSVLLLFFIQMYINPWLRDNAIIVCFGIKDGETCFGAARMEDKEYWESDEGKRHLKTDYINIYTIEAYKDFIAAQFPPPQGTLN